MNALIGRLRFSSCEKLPSLVISNGAVESLKWLALVAMTSDHVNKIFFKSQLPLMSEFGRIAMPLFGMGSPTIWQGLKRCKKAFTRAMC